MAGEGLPAHAVPDVPQLGGRVAGPRHEGPEVGAQGQAHHVARVAREGGRLLARLDVPQCTAQDIGRKTRPKGQLDMGVVHKGNRDRERERETERDLQRPRETERDRERQRKTETQRDRERHRHREIERGTETET